MRYSLILAFLFCVFISCEKSTGIEEPVEIPDLPSNASIVVEGIAGSSVERDTITSYILNPVVLEQDSNAPNPEIRTNFGIAFIVPDTIFEEWKSVHGILVYVVLYWENKHWYLVEIRRLD